MKKILLILVLVFLSVTFVSCNSETNKTIRKLFQENYIIVSNSNGLYGLMNQDFEMVVDFTYDEIHPFYNDLAIVDLDNKYGVIDSLGEMIIPTEYDKIVSHDNNLHFRAHKRYEYSYYDYEGSEITLREYSEAIGLSEEHLISFFRLSADAFGFTDIDGNVVIEPIFGNIYYDYFSDYNYVRTGGKWGVVDSDGVLIVPPTYREVSTSNVSGLTNVFLNGKWGLVENGSRYLYNAEYDMKFLFTEAGLSSASKNGLYGIVDTDGFEFIPIEYESSNLTSKSLYLNKMISLANETNYIYDSTGAVLYQTDLRIDNFNSKFILMTDLESETRYIKNYKNKTILEINNDSLYYFSNLDTDFIFKRQLIDEKICTIVYDDSGKIINPEGVYYNDITGYNYSSKKIIGFTSCGTSKAGFIDDSGEWIIEPNYNFKYYYIYEDGYILISVDGLWGMLDMKGNLILDFEYSSIGW